MTFVVGDNLLKSNQRILQRILRQIMCYLVQGGYFKQKQQKSHAPRPILQVSTLQEGLRMTRLKSPSKSLTALELHQQMHTSEENYYSIFYFQL